MSKDTRILTFRVEMEGSEAAPWIWDSHRAHILKEDAVRNGVTVTGIFDEDLIKKNAELTARLSQYEEEYGVLYDGFAIENDDGQDDRD